MIILSFSDGSCIAVQVRDIHHIIPGATSGAVVAVRGDDGLKMLTVTQSLGNLVRDINEILRGGCSCR